MEDFDDLRSKVENHILSKLKNQSKIYCIYRTTQASEEAHIRIDIAIKVRTESCRDSGAWGGTGPL